MKKVAVIANDVAMPGEKGLGRLYYFSGLLAANGFDVELITADFQHWEKKYRTGEQKEAAKKSSDFKIAFIHEPAYTKNIEPKRILSYRILAQNIKKYISGKRYDLIYALIPDNHITAVVGKYAKQNGIPFVVDVEDLWPEAMRMVFDIPIVSDILFSYFTVNAKKAYSYADAVIGSSDEYRDMPKKYGISVPVAKTVYVGNDIAVFDNAVAEKSELIVKPENEFWFIYAGTLGTSYDLATLISAADIIARKGYGNIKTLILGDGPSAAELKALADKCKADIVFTGFVPFDIMAAYLFHSDVTVNSLVAKASQSIVSKIGDYLAAGKPMINTGLNAEFCAKVNEDGFGINVAPGNAELLADAMLALYNDTDGCKKMGTVARKIAEEQFDRPKTYSGIIDIIKSLI